MESRNPSEKAEEPAKASSSDMDMHDLDILQFPPDIDWSSTLVIKCDPSRAPYRLHDVYNGLFYVLRRNNVFTLGPTLLSYAFTVSFRNNWATENFIWYLKNRMNRQILIKGLPVLVSRIPSYTVTVSLRWIPIEVDSVHVLEALRQYGEVVKTESVQSNMRGWFHVHTNERRFTLHLRQGVKIDEIPFGIYVKGLLGAVHVRERKPAYLQCYYEGHFGNECRYSGCPLFKPSSKEASKRFSEQISSVPRRQT